MDVLKTAAMLSLAAALSLVLFGPAQSAQLTTVSLATKPGTGQSDALLPVRLRGRSHVGGPNMSPYYYGGSYQGHLYGGFPGYPANGCSFPCWSPYGPYRAYYFQWY